MKQLKNLLILVSWFWVVSSFSFANAADFDQAELDEIIAATQEAEGISGLTVEAILYATGIQSYQLKETGWEGRGPLARLFFTDNGTIGTEKIGAHYSHLPTPAWEVDQGRVIAESAAAIPKSTQNGINIGADDEDVAWLNVKLQPNVFGLTRLLRVMTRSGISPRDVDNYRLDAYIGVGYTTFYVFLK